MQRLRAPGGRRQRRCAFLPWVYARVAAPRLTLTYARAQVLFPEATKLFAVSSKEGTQEAAAEVVTALHRVADSLTA